MIHSAPRWSVVFLLLIAVFLPSMAQDGYIPRIAPKYKGDTTALEIAQLPTYCYWQYVDAAYWGDPRFSIQGCGTYVNHYCPGLVKLMRAQSSGRPLWERRENIRQAIDDFNYTLGFDLPASCPIREHFISSLQRAKIQQQLLNSMKR